MKPSSETTQAHSAAQGSPTAADRAANLAFTSYLRVVAIAGVVLIHSLGLLVPKAPSGSLDRRLGTVLDLGATWCVPVFIMISGALLLGSGSGESLGQFYRRRLTRVGIPLVVWHVVYFAWREWGLHEHLDAHVVVRDVLTTRTYQALFFFWIIVGLYLVTPVLRAFVTVAARRDVAWFAGGAVVWMWAVAAGSRVLAHLHVTASPWNPPALVLFLPYIGYFLLGHVLRDVLVGRRALAGLVAVLVLCEVFLPWSYVHSADHPRLSLALTWGYQDLPAAASAICVFLIARSVIGPRSRLAQEPSRRRARRLGDLTFGVFLVHLLLLGLLTTQFPGIGRDMESRLEVALAVWALVLVTSFVVSAALARVPLLRRTVGA